MRTSDLLAVGEAAVLLRTTRQHVLDLCARGLLPYVTVGPHRRLRRDDVEALIATRLTRPQLEQLWLHQAIAIRFVEDRAAVLAVAATNLERLRRVHAADDAEQEWLDRWQITLDGGPGAILDALTSPVEHAVRLRQRSPFAGVLSEVERHAVLTTLRERRRDQVRTLHRETRARILRTG